MPQSRAQTLRSSVAGQRPSGQEPGTFYVNFADRQAGYLDPAKAPKDLIPIRYFETTAVYAAGDMVVKDGDIYVADIPITPGAFNPANWTTLFNVDDLAPLLDAKVDVAGDTMTGMLTLPVTTPTVANHATRKGYVDAQDTALQNAINLKLSDAPVDGLTYGRKDAAWSTVIGGASMLDGPPAGPLQNGQLWYETDTGNTYVYYNDGNSSQWVQQSGSLAVPLPPSIDGALISDPPPASPQVGQMWWESDSGRLFVWYNDGTSSQWVQISGPLVPTTTMTVVTSSGTYTKPANLKFLDVEVQAGGGGSGGNGATAAGQAAVSGGGGGGGYCRSLFKAEDLAATVAMTVGAAGTGSVGNGNGGTGGTSSFGALTAIGGTGGNTSAVVAATAFTAGGAGGGASGGQVNIPGQHGTNGIPFLSGGWHMGGGGGNSQLGRGGPLQVAGHNGAVPGSGYGGGARGLVCTASQAAQSGAAGAPGVIILREYF